MASMTVEFFKVVLKNSANDGEEDYKIIKSIFDEIKKKVRFIVIINR